MKKVLLYHLYYGDIPIWWLNFSNHHTTYFALNNGLTKYSATVSFDGDCKWITFESNAHYTWFVLRWS